MRKFSRAYARRRKEGSPAQIARSERTRGKALDIYQGAKRLDGTESTVGRFPRSRTSTGYRPLSSNIKSPKRFADSRIGVVPPIAKPIAKPAPIANPLAARAKPGSFRPGQLMNANAFPTNAIAKKPKVKHGYKDITPEMTRIQQKQTIQNNIQIALNTAKKQTPWLPATTKGNSRSATVAFVALNMVTGARRLEINSSHPRWKTPIADSIQGRRSGLFASANPAHVINHEIGHAKHRTMGKDQYFSQNDRVIARRVSKYANESVNEFVAEVRGARKVGSRFDAQIMRQYREFSGLSPKPAPRFRPTAKAKAAAAAKPAPKPARFTASESADRKAYAQRLMAQPKGVRKANYLQKRAQRNPDQLDTFRGRNKSRTQDKINGINEGRDILMAKNSRSANTPEQRASIERYVTASGRSLQARMKTTGLGPKLRKSNKPVTTKAAKPKSTTSKPKGLKPQNPATYGIAKTKAAKKEANDRLTKKYATLPDQATVNIPGRFRGQAGKRFEATIDRAVAAVAAARNAKFKTAAEVRATTAANKAAREAAAAAKPKRAPRTPASLRTSRAKQITKRRGMNIGPTAWRPSSASRMAENAARTQSRALAFYKGKRA